MRFTLLIVFLVFVVAVYSVPQLAEAQRTERCDTEICQIEITGEGFIPKTLIVKLGSTVIWTNIDDRGHTVTSGSPGEVVAPLKSLLLEQGDTYEFIFEAADAYKGSYKYFDQVTKTMRGEIIVELVEEEERAEEIPEAETIKIDFMDPDSGIKQVSLPNGSIKIMEVDPTLNSLIVTLENVEVLGILEITLDRNLIDSKTNGEDDGPFAVLVDGEEGFVEELSATPSERTLQIVVPSKATQIAIVGTQVIPEFPVAVTAVMGIIVASAIAVTRFKQRNGALPLHPD